MGQTSIIEATTDVFNHDDGVVTSSTKRTVKKSKIETTDEFIKVSRYLNVIFAYNDIPLNLVPISLLIAQEMEFKTNKIYLLIDRKREFAEMLNISLDRVNKLIQDCEKHDIIRRQARGIYEVNRFLFSTGSIIETRELQAHFDFKNDAFIAKGIQKNLITGMTVKKAVANKKDKQIAGQLSIDDYLKQQKTEKVKQTKFNNFEEGGTDYNTIEDQLLDN